MNNYLVECFIQGYAGQEVIQASSPSNAVIIYLCHIAVSKFNIRQSSSKAYNVRVTKVNGIRHAKKYYSLELWR